MSSIGMEANNSREAPEAAPPEQDIGNDFLCSMCLLSLTINDQLAGGTARRDTNGTIALDLSGFTYNDWESSTGIVPFRKQRVFAFHRKEGRGASGWNFGSSTNLPDGRKCTSQNRMVCAGDKHERLVTLPGMPELSASALRTCRLCSTIRSLFKEQYAENAWWNKPGSNLRFTMQYEWSEYRSVFVGEHEDAIPPSIPAGRLDGLAIYVVRPDQEPNNRDVFEFDVVAWPGQCQEWLKIKHTPMDPDGPMSDRNVDFINQRIEKCISEHSRCKKKSFNSTFVPTRLLELGDNSASSARLIECGQTHTIPHAKNQLQYATLSYCWGETLTMTTTKENKLRHQEIGIELHIMPKTFQDAIRVAKTLGIQYLWIDALCIVQDDKDDWEAESVAMCDIFAHSKVTISAAKSSSSAERFLERTADDTLTLQFQSILKPDISGQYSIRLEPRHDNPAHNDLERSQWVSRAWVWQEQVMSTRQLVFGNKTLQFRCSEGIFLENGGHQDDRIMVINETELFWYNAIRIYSSRKLKFASDRLKAIAGAAKFIESSNLAKGKPAEYFVGLWQNHDFEYQLRWVCTVPSLSLTEMKQLLQDREHYIAPSWSWASRNTSVDCLVNGTETAIRVIRSDLRAAHTSAMVSVAFGSSITISGRVRQIPVRPSSGHIVMNLSRWPHKWEASSHYGRTDFWLDWVPREEDSEEREYQRRLYLLFTTDIRWGGATAAGLIIAPVIDPGTRDTFYYRVGAFVHRGDRQIYTEAQEKELTIR